MPRLLLRLLVLFSLSALPQLTMAEDTDYSRSGWYVLGGLEVAWSSSSDAFPHVPRQSWVADPAVDMALGWRENKRLALEIEFEWIPSHEGIEYGSWLFGANGKFFFREDRIQPYLVLGANGFWAKPPGAREHEVDWGFRNGLGVDYYVSEKWALNFESSFVWGVGNVWKNYFLETGIGIVYRF